MPLPSLRRARTRLALGLAAVLLAPLVALAAPSVAPDELEARLERLVTELDAARVADHVPGLAIGVVVDGEPVLVRGLGERDRETGDPATGDTLFAIGSSTKSMTATIAAMLVDEGALAWDDLVSERYPRLRFHDEGANAAMTVGDLLSHASGVMRTDLLWYGGWASWADVCDAFATAEPVAERGEAFHYQNVCVAAAGMLTADLEGIDWPTQLRRRLLDPLGMERSTLSIDEMAADADHAVGYDWEEGDEDEGEPGTWEARELRRLDVIAPAGALNSSAREMTRWLAFVLARGGEALDGERFDEMWTTRMPMSPGAGYGYGWIVREWDGRRQVGHGGNIDGFSCAVELLPDDGIGFVLLMNRSAAQVLQGTAHLIVFDALLGALDDDAPGGSGEAGLERLEGDYDAEQLSSVVSVDVRDGVVFVDVPGQMEYELEPADEEGLRSFKGFPAIRVRFLEDDDAGVYAMELHQGGLVLEWPKQGVTVEREAEIPLDELRPFLGVYRLEAAGRDFTVLVRNERLAVDVPGEMVYELHPPDDDGRRVFRATDRIWVRFVEDEAGAVTMMELGSGDAVQAKLPRTSGPPDEADAADLPSVDLVMTTLHAMQGRDAYERIPTVELRGRVHAVNQGLEGPIRLVLAGYDRSWQRIDFGVFGWVENGMFGTDWVWTDASFAPFEQVEGDEAEPARQRHPMAHCAEWPYLYESVEVLRRDELEDGRPVLVLEGRPAVGEPVTLYVDESTGLLAGLDTVTIVMRSIRFPLEVRYHDYREHRGVQFPFRIVTQDQGFGRTEVVFDAIDFDVEVTGDMFLKNHPNND